MGRLIERYHGVLADARVVHCERAEDAALTLVVNLMIEQGVGQVELGRRMGVRNGLISKVLNKKTRLTVLRLADMLYALGRNVTISSDDTVTG